MHAKTHLERCLRWLDDWLLRPPLTPPLLPPPIWSKPSPLIVTRDDIFPLFFLYLYTRWHLWFYVTLSFFIFGKSNIDAKKKIMNFIFSFFIDSFNYALFRCTSFHLHTSFVIVINALLIKKMDQLVHFYLALFCFARTMKNIKKIFVCCESHLSNAPLINLFTCCVCTWIDCTFWSILFFSKVKNIKLKV